MLESLTQENFAERLNQQFQLRTDGGAVRLELQPEGARAPFSLVFRGPRDAPLAQMTYDVEHEELGGLTLFMVPIGPDGKGMLYEVVFN
jgi:hypothetical protein